MLFYELSLLKYYIVLLYCKWCVPGAIAGQPECERGLGQGVAGILFESFYFGILPKSFFFGILSECNWVEVFGVFFLRAIELNFLNARCSTAGELQREVA